MLEQIEAFQKWAGAPIVALAQHYWWLLIFLLGAGVAYLFFPNTGRDNGSDVTTGLGEDGDGDGGGDSGGGDGGGGD